MASINDYKPNSHKSKEQKEKKEKNLSKVVKGRVTVKEKTAPRKFLRSLLAEDAKTIEMHVVKYVIKPRALDIVYDAFTVGLEMALFGKVSRNRNARRGTHTSYGDYYRGGNGTKTGQKSRNEESDSRKLNRRTIYDLEQVEFEYREDAENVLDRMCEILEEYPSVSGADLCELLNKPSNYTDRKYGWTDLGNARIENIRGGGFLLVLPRAEVLE